MEFSCPGQDLLACRDTGITSAQDSDTSQFTLPMEGRRRFIFFPGLFYFFDVITRKQGVSCFGGWNGKGVGLAVPSWEVLLLFGLV